jgi:hypothetical protein
MMAFAPAVIALAPPRGDRQPAQKNNEGPPDNPND